MTMTYDERVHEYTQKYREDIEKSFKSLGFAEEYGLSVKTTVAAKLMDCTGEHIRKLARNGEIHAMYTDDGNGAKRFLVPGLIDYLARRQAIELVEIEDNKQA